MNATKQPTRLVRTEEQTREDVERWAAQAVRVMDERFPKPADNAPPVPDDKRPNVLVVSHLGTLSVAFASRVFDGRPWVDFGFVLTGMSMTGAAFDSIIYLPGWRGETKDEHKAADEWRARVVRQRVRAKGKSHEFYPS